MEKQNICQKKDKVRLMNICRASCSMLYILPVMMLDKVPYLDGEVADAIPIKHAMNLGYEKNIVVLTREKAYIKKDLDMTKVINSTFPADISK